MAMIVTTENDKRIAEQQIEQRELQRAQQRAAAGDSKAVKKIKANKDSNFEIGEHEQNLIHIFVLTRTLAADQQSFDEIKRVLKIQPRIFDQMIANSAFAAYTDAKVIHDPRPNAPKVYALKPVELKATPALGATDQDLARRESELAAREEKLRAMEERLAALEKNQGAKTTSATGDDLPPINLEGDQTPPTQTKTSTGKNSGKS